jgi:cyclopropane fatty-acyl-phospholipid synthase-like methyltransferase
VPLLDAAVTALAHERLTFNAPLGPDRASDLVKRVPLRDHDSALDLGCGWGELLLRLVDASPEGSGEGVDSDRAAIRRAEIAAADRGLAGRVRFQVADATTWRPTNQPSVVIAVGASHAWGGPLPALHAIRRTVRPDGRVLFGDGFWRSGPTEELHRVFGDLPDLPGLADVAAEAGFLLLQVTESTADEWDSFESDWRAGLELSGSAEARELAQARREEYLRGYRGVLGFGWLVLAPG